MWFRNASCTSRSSTCGSTATPTRRPAVSHGGAIFQFTGNTSRIVLSGNVAFGGARWANTQHGVYIGAGTVRDVTIAWNVFDGRAATGPGSTPTTTRTGCGSAVRDNMFRNWDTCMLVWSNIPSLVITRSNLTGCRIGLRYHESKRHPGHPQPVRQEQHLDPAGHALASSRVAQLLELTLSARGS